LYLTFSPLSQSVYKINSLKWRFLSQMKVSFQNAVGKEAKEMMRFAKETRQRISLFPQNFVRVNSLPSAFWKER